MKEMKGIDAIRLCQEISKVPDGCFTVAFYPYNRTLDKASGNLRVIENCKTRKQLPADRFSIESDNFFLFQDEKGNPKTCYRILLRFIGLPQDNFKLTKINWL